jgi:hypothetical protein
MPAYPWHIEYPCGETAGRRQRRVFWALLEECWHNHPSHQNPRTLHSKSIELTYSVWLHFP